MGWCQRCLAKWYGMGCRFQSSIIVLVGTWQCVWTVIVPGIKIFMAILLASGCVPENVIVLKLMYLKFPACNICWTWRAIQCCWPLRICCTLSNVSWLSRALLAGGCARDARIACRDAVSVALVQSVGLVSNVLKSAGRCRRTWFKRVKLQEMYTWRLYANISTCSQIYQTR